MIGFIREIPSMDGGCFRFHEGKVTTNWLLISPKDMIS